MGNAESSPAAKEKQPDRTVDGTPIKRGFPGSAVLESTLKCGKVTDTDDRETSFVEKADNFLCGSPTSQDGKGERFVDDYDSDGDDGVLASPPNPTAALFAKALVNEVSPGMNPKTMTPTQMAERERLLLKAQTRAKELNMQQKKKAKARGGAAACTSDNTASDADNEDGDDSTPRPIGMLEKASILGSLAHAVGADSLISPTRQQTPKSATSPHNSKDNDDRGSQTSPYTVTIGLVMSRRSNEGHSDTVTRQTAFDFNELQDRKYRYVSSTDSRGWRAGGGETGRPVSPSSSDVPQEEIPQPATGVTSPMQQQPKTAAPDTSHVPIIQIDAQSQQQVDMIISALARGEIFIPHMAVMPEALSVHGISPPDLVVRFGTERNEDLPPEDWPNWCLEFVHNQLYEYFTNMKIPVRWSQRPFRLTLAKQVRWKTVKHMNQYFAHAEKVIDTWREAGPQYLNPQLAYIEGGATPEEVARPHGIYLLRNGVPTNYFAPNFDPPYSTKMTRSLLQNVLSKSWDKKRREWASDPIPRLVAPSILLQTMLGCGDNNPGGYMATEVTLPSKMDASNIPEHLISHLSLSSPKEEQSKKGSAMETTIPTPSVPKMSGPVRGSSVATTILHTNMADKEEKKEESLTGNEEWLANPNNYQMNKETAEAKEALEKERQRQIALVAMAQDQAAKPSAHLTKTLQDPNKQQLAEAVTLHMKGDGQRSSKPEVPLTYSKDESTLFGDSTLMGQNYATDNSSTKDSRSNNAYPNLPRYATDKDTNAKKETEDDSVFSIQESTSSMTEVIPSDEDLFRIGWAKALDPSSGSYYYFTLDRSEIVWENPLYNHGDESASERSSPLPAGHVHI